MLRPTPAALRLVASLIAIVACTSGSLLAADAVEEARALLAKDDPRAAVDRLETALPETPKDRLPALLEVLRDAYEKAAARADADGKSRDANHYREGLKLLDRSRPAKPEAHPEPESAPPETPAAPASPEPDVPATAEPSTPEEISPGDLGRTDAAWKHKQYVAAGKLYATLARAGKLPPQRHDHWAYCRLVEVLERINAGPKTPADWAEIHAEIDHIRLLSPKNWYSEYLRNVVVERSGGVKRKGSDKLVLRGASPDERPAQPQLARPRAAATQPPRTVPARDRKTPAPEGERPAPPTAEIGHPGPAFGNWKTFITPSFQIFHNDEALARKVAMKAEAARRDAAKRWTGEEPSTAWTPKCDLYLYPTAAIFSAETQQPPESPGFSTAGLSNGRVTTRMVKLRADFAKMLDAVLPHEVTHVVLADLFPVKQVPRWADEGMSVLSEPESEQALRARDLTEPLNRDVLFHLDVLMTADYPSGNYWSLYYAQSVSLTRYLVSQGTPTQFVQFVRATQSMPIDAALKQVYRIEGVAALEKGWKSDARERLAARMVAESNRTTAETVKR